MSVTVATGFAHNSKLRTLLGILISAFFYDTESKCKVASMQNPNAKLVFSLLPGSQNLHFSL